MYVEYNTVQYLETQTSHTHWRNKKNQVEINVVSAQCLSISIVCFQIWNSCHESWQYLKEINLYTPKNLWTVHIVTSTCSSEYEYCIYKLDCLKIRERYPWLWCECPLRSFLKFQYQGKSSIKNPPILQVVDNLIVRPVNGCRSSVPKISLWNSRTSATGNYFHTDPPVCVALPSPAVFTLFIVHN